MKRSAILFVFAAILGSIAAVLWFTPVAATVMVDDTVPATMAPNYDVECGSVASPTPPGSDLGVLFGTGKFTEAEKSLLTEVETGPVGGRKECADRLAGNETGRDILGPLAIGLVIGGLIALPPRRRKVAPASPGDETGNAGA